MKTSLNYGKQSLMCNIPDKNYLGTLNPIEVSKVDDSRVEVKRALANPICSQKLKELVSSTDEVVILASDISRPAPSHVMLPPILAELNEVGVSDEQIKVIFGLGVHRNQTEEEKRKLVGDEIYNRVRCVDHDIDDCVDVGKTKRGTEVAIFKEVLKADFVIATGNLEFHYFAGFSGGAKALAPGVCGRKTIRMNHAHFFDPNARSGQIENNPVREEIEEIGQLVGVDFMVNAILNSHKQVIKVVAGDVIAAHRKGVKYLNDLFRVEIDELADIVVVSPGGFPKDLNLYQSQKAMDHASMAVQDGGTIILVAECRDGIGEEKCAQDLTGDLSPPDLVDELKQNFILGRHKAARIAETHLKSEVYLVSDLPKEIKEKLFFKGFDSLDAALQKALKVQGEDAKILIMPYGASTLPSYN